MSTTISSLMRGALNSIFSLFNKPKPQRQYKRISLEQLVKQCKKGTSRKSVYQRILAKRMAQLHRTTKNNKAKIHTKISKKKAITTTATKTRAVKPKKPSHKLTHPSTSQSNTKTSSTLQSHIKTEKTSDYVIKQESHYTFGCEDLKTIPCFIPDNAHYDKYAPSAPAWTPPPSPRRGSISDTDTPISLPSYESEYNQFPPPHFPFSANERVLMPPPTPTAPPIVDIPLYPRLAPLRTLSPQTSHIFPSSLSSSPPSRTPLVSSPPQPTRVASTRLQFAQNYIPQVKVNIPYVRPPPYSPDIPYSPDSPYSRPAPYSPTSRYAHTTPLHN